MKSFIIDEVLVYNPTLKSKKKKPIQSDIQQAKIMAFYPGQAMIQQKCNTVGMAQGVYAFCDSLLPEQHRAITPQTIFMDSCCLIQKQFQQNIWLFIKISHDPQPKYKQNYDEDAQIQVQSGYINNFMTELILEQFINHFYESFKIFYGKFSAFLFLENLFQLQKIIDYFVRKYQEINSYPNKEMKLDAVSYCIKNIRAVSLDVNTTLKFDYFKNVLQGLEPTVSDIIIFSHGYLAYSSIDKRIAEFFAKYLLGCVEPFKFQQQKIEKRFNILNELPKFNSVQKYGSIFNSIVFGFQQQNTRPSFDPRSSITTSSLTKIEANQDLLGIEQISQIQLPDIYLTRDQQQQKLKLSYFSQKNMLFITLFKQLSSVNQLIFTNRFFHDNSHKFYIKISQTLSNFNNQNDVYRFLFVNQSTNIGKCTFKDWQLIGNQIKYTLSRIKKVNEGQVCTTYQNHWVYGIKRLNRLLVLLVPNQVPLHKLDEFASKMTKEYFYKCFM